MKVSEKEIIPESQLKDNNIYCISFGNVKLALYKDNHFFALRKNKKIQISYIDSRVFAFCAKASENFNEINSEENLAIYNLEKENFINKKTAYTAAILNQHTTNELIYQFKDKVPNEWKIICHHMTINIGDLLNEFSNFTQSSGNLTCVAFGIEHDLQVAAILVETDIPSTNTNKHITFAIGDQGKASFSNKIEKWELLDTPFQITADIGRVLQDNTVVLSPKVNKKRLTR